MNKLDLLKKPLAYGIALALTMPMVVSAQQDKATIIAGNEANYSPYVDRNIEGKTFAEGLYWGDTHLHTEYSVDAGLVGAKLGPKDAYRFARGQVVTTNSGQKARISRPLDFLAVTDHAENIGMAPLIRESDPELLSTKYGKKWHDMIKEGKGYDAYIEWAKAAFLRREDLINNPKVESIAWNRLQDAAEEYNDPGVFTAIIGFEWTSIPKFRNLHRVVLFKDGKSKTNQVLPYSTLISEDPEDLWQYMADYEEKTGGNVLAIPHNGNWSNGLMFQTKRMNGKPFDAEYAENRMRWEPLYEVTQIKGDGEAHPLLSPTDEFADYGTWDKGDAAGVVAKEDWMLPTEYARSALQIGLQQQQKLGVNPFKFGMVGATDSHTGMAGTRDDNYWGKFAHSEPAADRYEHYVIKAQGDDITRSTYAWEEMSAGLAGVWARENTREALFEAMQNKETYATTGTRIAVRMFGGWNYGKNDVFSSDAVEIGYTQGVPMGGDLDAKPADKKAPTFMVTAQKDPISANLDRIQIVKGWVDANGERQEKIYDVAVSDNRKADANGRVKTPVGNTVDLTTATYLNSIGEAELKVVWTDPDFDPQLDAVYYTRVLEIPTPTWQAYDAQRFGVKMPEQVPMTHQERAYTSPIWYTDN